VTDDSAFKKKVRARMAETGEKYTVARRMVSAGEPSVVLRVHLNSHVDLELSAEDGRAYAAADEPGRREMVERLLAERTTGITAGSMIVTDQESRAEAEAAEDAAIRAAVQRGVDRVVGVSEVGIGRHTGLVNVGIRAARPILLVGQRGAEADRLRGELEELTGRRVRLDIWEAPTPPED
jgi:hypothetical protein